jgi:hypothetical protein
MMRLSERYLELVSVFIEITKKSYFYSKMLLQSWKSGDESRGQRPEIPLLPVHSVRRVNLPSKVGV